MNNKQFVIIIAACAMTGGIAVGAFFAWRTRPPASPILTETLPEPGSISYEERNHLPSQEYVEGRAKMMRRAQEEEIKQRFINNN